MALREVAIPIGVAQRQAVKTFQPPATMDEAEARRLELVDRVNDINNQLTIRNGARDEQGNFIEEGHTYWEWRKRAVSAKRYAESELRHLNLWIKQQRRAAPIHQVASVLDPSDAASLLGALYQLIHRLACEGVDLDPEEQALKDAVREFLNRPQGVVSASATPERAP